MSGPLKASPHHNIPQDFISWDFSALRGIFSSSAGSATFSSSSSEILHALTVNAERAVCGLWRDWNFSPAPSIPLGGRAASDLRTGIPFLDGMIDGIAGFFEPEPEAAPFVSSVSAAQVLDNFHQMEKVSSADRAALWGEVLAQLRSEGFSIPPGRLETYEDFCLFLEESGFSDSWRVRSLRTALTLIQNRESLDSASPPSLPLAVVIGPALDRPMSLGQRGFPLLDTLVKSGSFHVVYYEAEDEEDVRNALEDAVCRTGRRIHTLVIGGHGTSTTLALGGERAADSDLPSEERLYLSTMDLMANDLGDLNEMIDPEGQVLLLSCSNGSGREAGWNMANLVARALPGRSIYSTEVENNLRSLSVSPTDLSLQVEWWNGHPYVARWTPESGDALDRNLGHLEELFEEGETARSLQASSLPSNVRSG